MKKLISLISIIAILLTSLMVFASCGGAKSPSATDWNLIKDENGNESIEWKYETVKSGKENINLLTVRSKNSDTPAKMKDYEKFADLPWKDYSAYVNKIELSNISVVSDKAFYNMTALKTIDFGDDLTEIGNLAFAFCTSLTKVTIPEGVTTIGDSAFEACASLENAELPSTLTALGDRAFAYSRKLETLTVDETCFAAFTEDQLDKAFLGIDMPEIVKTTPEAEKPSDSDKPDESDKADESDTTESDKATDEKESDAAKEEEPPQNNVVKIIAVIVLALVIIGLIVGGILLARSNKNQTKDSRTVRKNAEETNTKADKKSNKNAKSNKGKKK